MNRRSIFLLESSSTHVTNHCSKGCSSSLAWSKLNAIFPVLDVRFCSYVWIGLSLDTNASVIIGSLKPLKCKIWNELFELNLLRFH
jgi:hypothetical protein